MLVAVLIARRPHAASNHDGKGQRDAAVSEGTDEAGPDPSTAVQHDQRPRAQRIARPSA